MTKECERTNLSSLPKQLIFETFALNFTFKKFNGSVENFPVNSTLKPPSVAEAAIYPSIYIVEEELRKPLVERNQELVSIWNAEILRLTTYPPSGKITFKQLNFNTCITVT